MWCAGALLRSSWGQLVRALSRSPFLPGPGQLRFHSSRRVCVRWRRLTYATEKLQRWDACSEMNQVSADKIHVHTLLKSLITNYFLEDYLH